MTAIPSRKFPATRMRRMRHDDFSRRVMHEITLTVSNPILPVFVQEGDNRRDAISSMPDVKRLSIDQLIREAGKLIASGIAAIALLPVIDADHKSETAEKTYSASGLILRAIRAFKEACPGPGVITDAALDAYTLHGHDGIFDDSGYALNNRTVETLVKQALSHAETGADYLAPSDMMDGHIGLIRKLPEDKGLFHTCIISCAARYASHYYRPFCEATGSGVDPENVDRLTC